MYDRWEYDRRSAVALDNFKKAVNKKKEENDGESKSSLNKWSAFIELVNKSQCDQSKSCDIGLVENVELVNISEENEQMDLDLDKNSTCKCESPDESRETIAQQLLEEFKSDCETNENFLEYVLFKTPGFGRICQSIISTVPASTVLNICKAFCRLSKSKIEENCEEFYASLLLPSILSRDSSKEIECSVFECLEKANYTSVCSLVLLPMMLKSTASCVLNVSFVNKISLQQKQFLLTEYLKSYTTQFAWVFPILLSIYTSIDAGNDESVNALMADYLLTGSITHKKDINFAKILYAVAVSMSKKDLSVNSVDLLTKLKKTAQENETAFKNRCLSVLADI